MKKKRKLLGTGGILLALLLMMTACSMKAELKEIAKKAVKGSESETESYEDTYVPSAKDIRETRSEETEEDIVQKEIERAQSALGGMPYYGDTSKCWMTAEQATAYAQLIADGLAGDFSFRGGYDENNVDILTWGEPFQVFDFATGELSEVDRFNVIMCDFSGEGVPYLYIYSSINDDYNFSYEIYGWVDNTAKLVFDTDREKSLREGYYLYEDENDQGRMKLTYEGSWGMAEEFITYSFSGGTTEKVYTRMEELKDDNSWHITENGVETDVYTEDEYWTMCEKRGQKNAHIHTLPYPCFYDMTPCTLEEMVNYLNAYAAAMSDGQSVPVEIKKADIVRHAGTGIITKGEIPQEKVDSLEILRQYINGEKVIAAGNADSASYTEGGFVERFYFGLADINNDSIQELLLSYKDSAEAEGGDVQIHFPPTYDCLANIYGIDSANGTYLVSEGSVCVIERLYVYDGTSFSAASSITGDWDASDDGGPYTIRENGAEREISADEFHSIMNDWNSRHTRISAKSANTHLDIENIENTFRVKIDVQSSGEWLVTSAE